jgi:hypothetical protein
MQAALGGAEGCFVDAAQLVEVKRDESIPCGLVVKVVGEPIPCC